MSVHGCSPLRVVVLACGCFDPFHPGHLKHLRAARRQGTHLVVAVTGDEHIQKPGHPAFPEQERAAVIAELRCVDAVFISRNAEEAIKLIRPHVYVKGQEYEGKLPEQKLVESLGGRVHFTREPAYSSSAILAGKHAGFADIGGG